MINPVEQFRAAIAAAGLTPPENIRSDGELMRFASNGQQGDDAGWYVMYEDVVSAGVFGCWREGIKQYWCSKSRDTMTLAERETHRLRVMAMRQKREADLKLRQDKAMEMAPA